MINDCTISYLMNLAMKSGISVILTSDLEPDVPSACSLKYRRIMVNLNAPNPAFQLAHELGHIFSKSSSVLYLTSFANQCKIEGVADRIAISLLSNYYFEETDSSLWNIERFISYYKIPSYLREYCFARVKENAEKFCN